MGDPHGAVAEHASATLGQLRLDALLLPSSVAVDQGREYVLALGQELVVVWDDYVNSSEIGRVFLTFWKRFDPELVANFGIHAYPIAILDLLLFGDAVDERLLLLC